MSEESRDSLILSWYMLGGLGSSLSWEERYKVAFCLVWGTLSSSAQKDSTVHSIHGYTLPDV